LVIQGCVKTTIVKAGYDAPYSCPAWLGRIPFFGLLVAAKPITLDIQVTGCCLISRIYFGKLVFVFLMTAMELLSDQELLDLLRSGDRAAYTEIYHRYKFILHNHAFNKLRNKEEAQDILQEVFVNLWLKRESIQVTNLSGYLYSAVRNRILDYFAHNQVKLKYIDQVEPDLSDVPTDYRVRENQLRELIEKEIAELSPRVREVFEMSRKRHMTHKEIADALGTSEETVKKQVSGALKLLRMKLGILIYVFLLFHY